MTDKKSSQSELAGLKPPESDFGKVLAEALANLSREKQAAPVSEQPKLPPIGAGFTFPYGNRYYLWANNNIVRVLIGDSIDDEEPSWKAVFAMTRSDAAALADSIVTLLKDTEPGKKPKS